MEILTTREIENFGRNLRFVPQVYYEPSTEAELVQILKRHAGQKIKAIGRTCEWNQGTVPEKRGSALLYRVARVSCLTAWPE